MDFKNEYRKAVEEISPDKTELERMKANVLEAASQRKKPLPIKKISLWGGAVAACAVIGVAVAVIAPRINTSDSFVADYAADTAAIEEYVLTEGSTVEIYDDAEGIYYEEDSYIVIDDLDEDDDAASEAVGGMLGATAASGQSSPDRGTGDDALLEAADSEEDDCLPILGSVQDNNDTSSEDENTETTSHELSAPHDKTDMGSFSPDTIRFSADGKRCGIIMSDGSKRIFTLSDNQDLPKNITPAATALLVATSDGEEFYVELIGSLYVYDTDKKLIGVYE